MENINTQNIRIRKSLDASYVSKGISYEEYRRMMDAFIIIGKSTAKKDSENLLEYSKLNVVRMNRLDKTIELILNWKKLLKE
jgi:hypothetical protein